MLLRRALWAHGLRYRLHARDIPGTPDIVLRSAKIAIFCDGDFWHGRRWEKRERLLARGANAAYWTAKIRRNIERDRRLSQMLRREGWLVIRVWEGNVKASPDGVADAILKRIAMRTR